MLIEFTVGNYRSFKEPQTLSMVAAPLKSKDALDVNNVIETAGQPDLLTSAAIYGANASGKSNLIEALYFMRYFVLSSPSMTRLTGGIRTTPFRLSIETKQQPFLFGPSLFEAVFIVDGIRYRYGFETTRESVEREWLYSVPTTREALLFERKVDSLRMGRLFAAEGKGVFERTRSNALFLSVVAQFNGPIASNLVNWFLSLAIDSTRPGLKSALLSDEDTTLLLQQPERAREINELIQRLDLGIRGIRLEKKRIAMPRSSRDRLGEFEESVVEESGNEPAPRQSDSYLRTVTRVRTMHTIFDQTGQPTGEDSFDLNEHESEGTRRLFALAGPLLAMLREGGVMVIDELDVNLHPLITRELVALFNSRDANPHGAQLIFTTQDTNLLDNELFRRDQIWFVEKNRYGASQLYSLAEFKGVRNDLSFERGYIEGRFGAIPYLNPNKLRALLAEDDGQEA